ncbi:hypothetical protein D3C77_761230 [compost metagenome]
MLAMAWLTPTLPETEPRKMSPWLPADSPTVLIRSSTEAIWMWPSAVAIRPSVKAPVPSTMMSPAPTTLAVR